MTVGKTAAQCGHATQLAWRAMTLGAPDRLAASRFSGTGGASRRAAWAELAATAPVCVMDAGFTEIAPGTVTTLARWDRQ